MLLIDQGFRVIAALRENTCMKFRLFPNGLLDQLNTRLCILVTELMFDIVGMSLDASCDPNSGGRKEH